MDLLRRPHTDALLLPSVSTSAYYWFCRVGVHWATAIPNFIFFAYLLGLLHCPSSE